MAHLLLLFNAASASPAASLFVLRLLAIVDIVGFHHLQTRLIGGIGHFFAHQAVPIIETQFKVELSLEISVRSNAFIGENTGQVDGFLLGSAGFQLDEILRFFDGGVVLS